MVAVRRQRTLELGVEALAVAVAIVDDDRANRVDPDAARRRTVADAKVGRSGVVRVQPAAAAARLSRSWAIPSRRYSTTA